MKKKKFMLVALFTMFLAGGLFAQPLSNRTVTPPGEGGDGGGTEPTNPAPIDGGVIALVVAGAAYGIKRNIKE